MPYTFYWQDERHTIGRLDIQGQITWEQYYAAVNQIIDELAAVSHRVDLIYYNEAGMPSGNPIPHLRATSLKLFASPNLGLICTVITGKTAPITRLMVDSMLHTYRIEKKHHGGFVDTLDEAIALIARDRGGVNAG
ncbi:MAG TPA: hypothetical protein VHL11_08615 [Phototrophicaceae bacterium]|jgi:hypothetical protein|nr:hypothetical protein [Phototrophicaceae bacterium]